MSTQEKTPTVELLPILPVPKFGEPCNGCGMCCQQMPCGLAAELLNCTEGPCVALELHEGRTMCGLVVRPAYYLSHIAGFADPELKDAVSKAASELFSQMLGIGKGCCSSDGRVRAWAKKMMANRQVRRSRFE